MICLASSSEGVRVDARVGATDGEWGAGAPDLHGESKGDTMVHEKVDEKVDESI